MGLNGNIAFALLFSPSRNRVHATTDKCPSAYFCEVLASYCLDIPTWRHVPSLQVSATAECWVQPPKQGISLVRSIRDQDILRMSFVFSRSARHVNHGYIVDDSLTLMIHLSSDANHWEPGPCHFHTACLIMRKRWRSVANTNGVRPVGRDVPRWLARRVTSVSAS